MRAFVGAALVLLLLPAVARAADEPDEKIVEATKVFKVGESLLIPGNCVDTLFAQYKEIKNYSAIRWTTKIGADPATASEISGEIYAPYNDVYRYGGFEWRAPNNQHWSLVSESWVAGPPPPGGGSNCSGAKTKELFQAPIKVLYRHNRGLARISGYVEPVKAFNRPQPRDDYGRTREIEELPDAEKTKLLSGLTVIAKGPKKTFKAPVTPDGVGHGFYKMEIPGRYYGRYKLSVKGPKSVSPAPLGYTLAVKPGVEAQADWTMGYDCTVNPPGMSFAPRREHYVDNRARSILGIELLWNCRARAGRLRVHNGRLTGNWNAGADFICAGQNTGQVWDAYGLPEGWIESHTMRLTPTGELGPSSREINNTWTFKGIFANANHFHSSISSPGCGYEVGELLQGAGEEG